MFQAEKEPILSSFLYASILSHDCLEQALAFVLANRLHNPTLLATQLMDIIGKVILNDRDIQRAIRLDMQVISLTSKTMSTILAVESVLGIMGRILNVWKCSFHRHLKIEILLVCRIARFCCILRYYLFIFSFCTN